jgi:hypothetical protein
MKKFYKNLVGALCFFGLISVQLNAQLVLTAVFDGSLSGGNPKGVELYVTEDIPDLSIFGLGSANNGSGTDGEEFSFPNVSANAGDFIYVSASGTTATTSFLNYFGFAPDYSTSAMGINGDDAVELFQNGGVIDTYGDPNTNGDFEVWDYTDGWAYRVSGTEPGTFDPANWNYSGANALDDCNGNSGNPGTNATCPSFIPVGSYTPPVASPLEISIALDSETTCNDSDEGSLTATVTGGTPGYTYTWSNGATAATAADLEQGTYTVTVTDNDGTTGTASATVTGPDAIAATATSTENTGAANGSITLNMTGGTAPYTFTITYNAVSTTYTNQASPFLLENLADGTYAIVITDVNFCTPVALDVEVFDGCLADAGDLVYTGSAELCEGETIGDFTADYSAADEDQPVIILPPTSTQITEIRIDQPGSDSDEFFELYSAPGTDLTGLSYIVIGDGSGGSGAIESVTSLDGQVVGSSGYFVVAESSFSIGTADYTASLAFENDDNLTHVLVQGLNVSNGFDLDTDNDGVIDGLNYPAPNPILISEIHYDNAGSDVGEGVEVSGIAGTDLSTYQLIPYNGSGGTSYSPITLSGTIPDSGNGFGAVFFPISGFQNGSPDGIALVSGSTVLEFLSYEGSFTATNGPANGMTSVAIGVSETSSSPVGESLQLTATGWVGPITSTYDALNTDLEFAPWTSVVSAVSLVKSPSSGELYYATQLGGSDVGPDGPYVPGQVFNDGTQWQIGEFGPVGTTDTPGSGAFSSSANFSYFWMLTSGAPDYNIISTVQGEILPPFTGSFDNVAPGTYCVVGMMFEGDLATFNGLGYTNALDAQADADAGTICGDVNTTECIEITVNLASTADAGADFNICSNDIINLLATANGDGEWSGGLGSFDDASSVNAVYTADPAEYGTTVTLTWTTFAQSTACNDIADEIMVTIDMLPDSEFSYDASEYCPNLLLVEATHNTGDAGFFSYNVVSGGPSLDLDEATGAFNPSNSDQGTYEITNSVYGFVTPFISELHYDNDGLDEGESIEITGSAGTNLTGYSIILYNGSNGQTYDIRNLTETIPNENGSGFGTVCYEYGSNNIQNGFPDGLALVDPNGMVVEFLSYEGTITAVNGPAAGMTSTDLGVEETFSTPIGHSLQLEDAGWAVPAPNSCGSLNANLDLTALASACPDSETTVTITIADDEAPVIVCPADIVVNLDPGACEAIVSFEVTATDNCYDGTDVTIVQTDATGLVSGDYFYYGSYTLSFNATDGNNNTASCSFDVTVNEYANPTATLVCNDNLQVSLDENGEGYIDADMILEGGPYGCYDDYIVEILGNDGTNYGQLADCSMIGSTVNVMVTDPDTGNSCWGAISVEDKINPEISCFTYDNVPCTQNIDILPGATATDNCTLFPNIELVSETTDVSGNCADGVIVTRTYVATDDSGNVSETCETVITIVRPNGPNFPADQNIDCAAYDANNDLTDPLYTGQPAGLDGTYCQYSYTHTDETFDACGTGFKIYRTWVVLDLCTNDVFTHQQLISVVDETAPAIDASTITLFTDGNACVSNGFIPAPNVTDNCNDFTITMFTNAGELIYANGENGNAGGYIPGAGLELGSHVLTINATDACGNTSTETLTIVVEDNISPTMVCLEITDVNLNSAGEAVVFTSSFDNGTYDNCCLDYLQVRRMDGFVFGESVTFDCSDSEEQVILRAYDCYGNYNECMVEVLVNDKLNPYATCPQDNEIDCDTYYTDYAPELDNENWSVLDDFGTAIVGDNCSNFDETYTVSYDVDQCGVGSITRTWSVIDASGNGPANCSQTISVYHVSDWDVSFPADFDQPVDADCDYDAIDFGYPEISNSECEMIAVAYEDTQFNVPGQDACFKIFREWTIINWCSYDQANSQEILATEAGTNYDVIGSDYISYTQTIKVKDDVAPTVSAEAFNAEITSGCGVDINLDDITIEGGCNTDVYSILINDGDLDAYGSNGSYENVPAGEYTVSYTVIDPCGNAASTTRTIIVTDKAPTAFCVDALVITVMQNGMVEVPAADFDAGSFDNCGDIVSFTYDAAGTLPVMMFDCDDIGELQLVQVHVTDEGGLTDFCEVIVEVQDNLGVCDQTPLITLAGTVATEEGAGVENAMVDVNNGQSTVNSDVDGQFAMEVEQGGDYSISTLLDSDPENGVTTYDLVIISQHILGLTPMNSPYKLIAADANNSGSVTTLDLVTIRRVILQIDENFQNNTSWRFVDADYVFPVPSNPWSTGFPEVINMNNVDESVLDADFVAVKIGDVNASAQTNSFTTADDRSAGSIAFTSENAKIEAGNEFTFELSTDELLAGFQFTLDFNDAVKFVSVNDAKLNSSNIGLNKVEKGSITVSWNDFANVDFANEGKILSFTFKAMESVNLSEIFTISSSYTKAEAYNSEAELFDVVLDFNTANATTVLFQNEPNPFNGVTTVNFSVEKAGDVSLSFVNMAGQQVKVFNIEAEAGLNTVTLSSNELGESGVYYYTLKTDEVTLTKKMVTIK